MGRLEGELLPKLGAGGLEGVIAGAIAGLAGELADIAPGELHVSRLEPVRATRARGYLTHHDPPDGARRRVRHAERGQLPLEEFYVVPGKNAESNAAPHALAHAIPFHV